MSDLTVVIAHRGPLLGLWATIQSCILELESSAFDYNFVIVVNGEKFGPAHLQAQNATAITCKWLHNEEPLSPPSARNLGVKHADGRVLFFFDNHCLPSRGFFDRAIKLMERDDVDVVHSVTAPNYGQEVWHEYKINPLALAQNFWGGGQTYAATHDEPYKIAVGNHGGFAVKRTAWDDVDGYFDGFVGWAGEESYFDLKMWLMGKTVWLDPKMICYHYFENRSYPRSMTDDYYRNMMMAANIIGGQPWLKSVAGNFRKQPRMVPQGQSMKSMNALAQEALERSQPRAEWLRGVEQLSLTEFLNTTHVRGIAN